MNATLPRDWSVLADRMAGWLPPEGPFAPAGAWKLSYERHALVPEPGGKTAGGQAGGLVIAYAPDASGPRVHVTEAVVTGATTVTTTAAYQCAADQLLTPTRWDLDIRWESRMPRVPVAGLDQKRSGRVEGGEIVCAAAKERRRTAPRNWTADWLLFAVLPRLPFAAGATLDFDLFEEGELHKPDQKLAYAGAHAVEVGGKNIQLHVFEQFGRGVTPTRWWLDAQHRVVLAASERRLYLLGPRAKGATP
jgi:hypothetical protein